jgi:hypothetical protein
MGMIDASPFAFRVTGRMEAKDGVIEPRLKIFLMAARVLLQINQTSSPNAYRLAQFHHHWGPL